MTSHIRFHLLKNIKIPIEIFELKRLSALENIVLYLTHKAYLKQNEIAFLLRRDPATIWTILTRAKYKIKLLKEMKDSQTSTREDKQIIKETLQEM